MGTEVIIDRFQVARASRDGADTVRKQEFKRLSERCPRPSMPSARGWCGRFGSGLWSSSDRHGSGSIRCASTHRRSKRPTTYGKT